MGRRDNPNLESMAKTLEEVVVKHFKTQERLTLSKAPKLEKNNILEYDKRLKVSAMDKFNNPGYPFAVNYYASEADIKKFKPLGAVILYFVEKDIAVFLKAFELRNFDDENPEEIASQCREFGQQISKQFLDALSAQGYLNLTMSAPICERNDLKGVLFSLDQYDKYEISFYIKDVKTLVAELTMTVLPRK